MNCPICDYDKIEQVYPKLAQSVTSDSKLVKCEVSNVICKNCGNIFNQKGSRNQVLEFYKNDYKLMDSSSNANHLNPAACLAVLTLRNIHYTSGPSLPFFYSVELFSYT